MKRVIFYNNNNCGDVHVGRGFVRQIMKKLAQTNSNLVFSYSHRHSAHLLQDINGLHFSRESLTKIGEYAKDPHAEYTIIDDDIYINTWYNYRYTAKYGISFDNLYASFDSICRRLWGFSLTDISANASDFFPDIDYSKFYIKSIKYWMSNHPSKKIFISNGKTLSGQSHNYLMAPLINEISRKHKDKVFILSNKECDIQLEDNIIYASDIIEKNIIEDPCDLNENSFISTYCDVIIGRNSGAFTYCITKENFFKSKKNILCIYNVGNYNNSPIVRKPFWLAGSNTLCNIQYSSNIMEIDTCNKLKFIEHIEKALL